MKKNGINTVAVKKILPHGAIKEIAKRSKVTIFTASRVVNGVSKNQKVITELGNYIEEIKASHVKVNSLALQSESL